MKGKMKRQEEKVDEEQVKGKGKKRAWSQREDRQKERGYKRGDNVAATRRHSWKLAIPESSAAVALRG